MKAFKNYSQIKQGAVALFLVSFSLVNSSCNKRSSNADHNKKLITSQFKKWEQGTGSLFDLLAEDAKWKVAGSGPGVISGTYNSKKEYMDKVVNPISAKLSERLSPKLLNILAEGDDVVVFWQGKSTALDGKPYSNSYAWRLTIKNDQIINVTSFLDTYALHELMERVQTTNNNKNLRYE